LGVCEAGGEEGAGGQGGCVVADGCHCGWMILVEDLLWGPLDGGEDSSCDGRGMVKVYWMRVDESRECLMDDGS